MANEVLSQKRIADAIYSWNHEEYGWGDYYGGLGGDWTISEELEKYVCSDKRVKTAINRGVAEGDYCDIEDAINYMPCKGPAEKGDVMAERGWLLLQAIIDYFYTHPSSMNALGKEILSYRDHIDDPECIETAEAMAKYTGGIEPKIVKPEKDFSGRPQVLAGLRIVFTGKSEYFVGDDVEKFIEAHGAKCSHKVDKNTDILVTGDKSGQKKVDAAFQLGVREMSESEFFERYDLNPKTGTSYDTPETKMARHNLYQDARAASAKFAAEILGETGDDEDFDFDGYLDNQSTAKPKTIADLTDDEMMYLPRIQQSREAEIERMEKMLDVLKNSSDDDYKKFFNRLVTMMRK